MIWNQWECDARCLVTGPALSSRLKRCLDGENSGGHGSQHTTHGEGERERGASLLYVLHSSILDKKYHSSPSFQLSQNHFGIVGKESLDYNPPTST